MLDVTDFFFFFSAVGHVFKQSTAYACPRHVRERMTVSEDKPVKLVNAIKPLQVKAVTQARKQLAAKEKSPIETLVRKKLGQDSICTLNTSSEDVFVYVKSSVKAGKMIL